MLKGNIRWIAVAVAAVGMGLTLESSANAQSTGSAALSDGVPLGVTYTLLGDTNLDGNVTAPDFTSFPTNFNPSTTPSGTDQGDYDADVDGGDFTTLAAHFAQQADNGSAPLPSDIAALDTFYSANDISVPEPASAVVLVIGAIGMLGRRRPQPIA